MINLSLTLICITHKIVTNTYRGNRETIPAEMEENASLTLGIRYFFWRCSCNM